MIKRGTYGIKRSGKGSKRAQDASKPKKQGKTAPKLKSISKLIKEADSLFSRKVRVIPFPHVGLSDEDLNIMVGERNACYTCGKWYEIKKLHCGHFLSRYYKAARWNYDNARPQCMMCNMWKRGDPIRFRQNLVTEIGEERVLNVEKLRDASIKLNREYLTTLIQSLQESLDFFKDNPTPPTGE